MHDSKISALMSALGQKQTSRHVRVMSALPPKADINLEDLVAEAKRLHRKRLKGGYLSLRAIAAELAKCGHFNERGKPFSPSSVRSMVV